MSRVANYREIDPVNATAVIKAASEKSARNILGPLLNKKTGVYGWFLTKDWNNFYDPKAQTYRFEINHTYIPRGSLKSYLEMVK